MVCSNLFTLFNSVILSEAFRLWRDTQLKDLTDPMSDPSTTRFQRFAQDDTVREVLQDFTRLIKCQARGAGVQRGRITIAQIAQEIRPIVIVPEKFFLHALLIEP